jgi:hypothetical protein
LMTTLVAHAEYQRCDMPISDRICGKFVKFDPSTEAWLCEECGAKHSADHVPRLTVKYKDLGKSPI